MTMTISADAAASGIGDVVTEVATRELLASGKAREIRRAARLSLADAARAVGVHESTVARWETSKRSPRGATARRYGNLLADLMRTLEALR